MHIAFAKENKRDFPPNYSDHCLHVKNYILAFSLYYLLHDANREKTHFLTLLTLKNISNNLKNRLVLII